MQSRINNRTVILFLILIVILLGYSLFSTKIGFTDTAEYINVAKAIAGLNLSNVFIFHSISYAIYLSLFLKMFASIIILKIANSLWIIGDAIILYLITKDYKAVLLLVLSPIVYYMSIYISPILAVSFFILISYYSLNRYCENSKISYFVISALSFGMIGVMREASIIIMMIFFIVFFYDKKLKQALSFLAIASISFSLRFIIDYYYFRQPFYTLMTFIGGTFTSIPKGYYFSSFNLLWIISLFMISPLIFLIYKIDFKAYKREILFCLFSFIWYTHVGQLRYLFEFGLLFLIPLSKLLKPRHLFYDFVISIILIIFLTHNYFGNNRELIISNDMKQIKQDFNLNYLIVTDGGAYALESFYWDDNELHYIWFRDYQMSLDNKTIYREFNVESRPRINADKIIGIKISIKRNSDVFLNNLSKPVYFAFMKDEFDYDMATRKIVIHWKGISTIDNIEKIKCYQDICIFKK